MTDTHEKPIAMQVNETCEAMAQDIVFDWDRETPKELKDREATQDEIQEALDRLENDQDDLYDKINESVDSSEWVIYYHKAHQVCQNCNLDYAESTLEEIGRPSDVSYDGFAVALAYWCLEGLVRGHMETLIKESIEELEGMLE